MRLRSTGEDGPNKPRGRASAQCRAGAGWREETTEGSARQTSAQDRGAGQNEKPGGVRLRSARLRVRVRTTCVRARTTCVRARVRERLVRLWFGRPWRGTAAEGVEVRECGQGRGSGWGLGRAAGGEGSRSRRGLRKGTAENGVPPRLQGGRPSGRSGRDGLVFCGSCAGPPGRQLRVDAVLAEVLS